MLGLDDIFFALASFGLDTIKHYTLWGGISLY